MIARFSGPPISPVRFGRNTANLSRTDQYLSGLLHPPSPTHPAAAAPTPYRIPVSTFVLGSEGHTVHAPPSVMAALLWTPVAFPKDDARETWYCRRPKRVRQPDTGPHPRHPISRPRL